MRLNQWLIERYRAGGNPVLIVDEAQRLPAHLLEEIRMLLDLKAPREKLLQIVPTGQPEIEERFRRHELRQLQQSGLHSIGGRNRIVSALNLLLWKQKIQTLLSTMKPSVPSIGAACHWPPAQREGRAFLLKWLVLCPLSN